MRLSFILFPLSLFLLVGCTEVMVGSHILKRAGATQSCAKVGANKVGNPYLIDGQRYVPVNTSQGFTEEGIASWYGDDFHGKATANGECYNMYAFTAAHRTLPLPTVVRVTNLENNKSVVVKVNDRGPFARGRVIDLSYAAAQSIGMIGKGTAPVKIEAIGGAHHGSSSFFARPKNSEERVLPMGPRDSVAETLPTVVPSAATEEELPPLTRAQQQAAVKEIRDLGVPDADASIPPPPAYEARVFTDETPLNNTLVYVQVGAFSDTARATAEQLKLKEQFSTAHISVIPNRQNSSENVSLSRVRVGPFRSVADAEAALKNIEGGWPSAQIKVERR